MLTCVVLCIVGCEKVVNKQASLSTSSDKSTISAEDMWSVFRCLETANVRQSMKNNYMQIWQSFNCFLLRLDVMPKFGEQRVALYCAYLVENGGKSATLKSYISVIKFMLRLGGYDWNEKLILLDSLTRACHLINDRVYHRLPIHKSLLETLLFELEHLFVKSPYIRWHL